jgi:hypothetical protein
VSRDDRKRRGIDGAAAALRKQAAKSGKQITHQQARDRVRKAVVNAEKKKRR